MWELDGAPGLQLVLRASPQKSPLAVPRLELLRLLHLEDGLPLSHLAQRESAGSDRHRHRATKVQTGNQTEELTDRGSDRV